VKLRGVRLELEELSSVTQHAAKGALAHCAVIVKGEDDRSEQHHLIAFVVVHTSFPGNVHDLCDTLFDTIPLPAYAKPVMITPEMSVSSFLPQLDTLQPHGYASSKWASEVFLEKASTRYGAPVTVYRPTSLSLTSGDGDGYEGSRIGKSAPPTFGGNVLGSVLALSRAMRAVPRTTGWKGYIDLVWRTLRDG
jgi:hypothetical protein